ncbi:tetraacyldisaccharide 4'-kinase [Mucisphaera sp.]|uniref:tetraacyldisaccharide 4'-kinase n=1 Tax=Mucisphaera sp. TaxID=2913024 RepID=UPI003D0FB47F
MSRWIEGVMSGDRVGGVAAAARLGLGLAEPFYRWGVTRRNRAYDRGAREVVDLGRPVVSVGNLTTGGTGKTPMVVEVVRRLQRMGKRPAVLLRGYGSELRSDGEGSIGSPRAMGSDEARVYAAELPGVMVAADPDRVRSARWVLAEDAGVEVFVLDDGFQHRRVRRELDLVLVDAMNPWGFGHLLPRGLLREPVEGLARADGVVVTRADRVDEAKVAEVEAEVKRLAGEVVVSRSASAWRGYRGVGDEVMGEQALRGKRVYVATGLGNPGAMVSMAREAVGEAGAVVGEHLFGDHHDFSEGDVREVATSAERAGADVVLTTEKDWVKLRSLVTGEGLAWWRPVLETGWVRGEAGIDRLLRGLFEGRRV